MDNDLYRRRAQKRVVIGAIVIAAGALLYWHFSPWLSAKKLADLQNAAENFAVTEIKKQVSLPPPLRGGTTPPQSPPPAASAFTLTRAGIVTDTNAQRKMNGGLPALAENVTLDAIASARAADMFQKQYFAHVAPDGGSAETVAKAFGYDYLTLGENIALGEFAGDSDLVQAWMNSPGHRANILNTHYTQIGVAAREGMFEGKDTWIAVQIFGKPTAACPSVSASLKATIAQAQNQLSQMQTQMQAKKSGMDAMEPKSGSAYNQEVDEYNALVRQYNALLEQTRSQVAEYNAEVAAFNQCVQAG